MSKIWILTLPFFVLVISVAIAELAMLGLLKIIFLVFPNAQLWLFEQLNNTYINLSILFLHFIILGVLSLSIGIQLTKYFKRKTSKSIGTEEDDNGI